MLQARCSLSVCPGYMRHKYVKMDVNSAFLKLTNTMAFVKIILNDKQQSLLTWIPQLSTINKYLRYQSKNLEKIFFSKTHYFFLVCLKTKTKPVSASFLWYFKIGGDQKWPHMIFMYKNMLFYVMSSILKYSHWLFRNRFYLKLVSEVGRCQNGSIWWIWSKII